MARIDRDANGEEGMGDQGQVGGQPGPGAELSAAIMGAGRAGPSGAAVGTSSESAPSPQSIGHFRILERLGVGGMGVVYKAQQERPHRLVALKVIRAGLLGARAIRRFEFEAEILGRLQHPGIAQIYEAGAFDAGEGMQPYFAMELIDGRPLTRFAREQRLDARQRLGLMTRICDAVQHAHQRGVIHRDLKPANILVEEATKRRSDEATKGLGQPKILDFGVARATDADVTATLSGGDLQYAAGTLPYMSPEQLSGGGGTGAIDVRSDVYSLGVVCYELLTDRLPYAVASNAIFEAARVIREQEPPSAGSVNRLLRGDVETVLRTALEKDPSRRYQSAAEFAADIERYLNHEPIRARPPSALYRLRKFARRNRALVTGLAVAFAVLLLGIAATTWQALRATTAQARAVQRFNDLRSFADTVIFDIDAAVRDLPDSAPARRVIVQSALQYLARLREDAGGDEGLLIDLARGYEALVEIQGLPRARSLGDVDGALESCRQARQLREILLRATPGDPERQHALARVHSMRGTVLASVGRVDEAAGDLNAARESHRRSWQANPSDARARNRFVIASIDSVMNYQWSGHFDAPEIPRIVDDTVQAMHSLPEPVLSIADFDAHPAIAHLALARLCLRAGRGGEAEKELAIAQPLLEAAAAMYPAVTDFALSHSDVYRYRAHMRLAAGDPIAAGEDLERALAILSDVAASNPTNYASRHAISGVQADLASALAEAGEADRAIATARAALSAMEAEAASEPNSYLHRESLIEAYGMVAGILERLAGDVRLDLPRRLDWLRESRDRYARLVDLIAEYRKRGQLSALYDATMETIRQSIARLDAGIGSLEAQIASQRDGGSP